MKITLALMASLAALSLSAIAVQAAEVVTVYSADGLHDGTPNWYQTEFDAFTKATGIQVQYVEGGSGVVVDRIEKEASNPQADVVVTLPPFIQKAAADGDLQAYTPAGADQIPAESKDANGTYYSLVNNYLSFIYNADALKTPPKSFDDLLSPQFKGKIQYSTPGQAGDGTAVMLLVEHAYGSKDAAFDFFKKLQANNVGPSSSTGKLTALVNKGELYVANGDLQMNTSQMADNPNIKIFFPAGPDGTASTIPLPYVIGLVKGAPHADNAKKFIDFMLSKDAQSSITSVALGLPARSDVTPDDEHGKALQQAMSGVKVWTPDWSAVLKDLAADTAKWHEATGS
ncbi:MAG TPA: 2-aminoethylphosphonate ABC transporter substrate-binding protein [Devosia sp.]|nr:2-aminoethylphosphonate ABC transporter substrate-binding protein [Devosia sp.]